MQNVHSKRRSSFKNVTNQSINQFINVNTWDGFAPIIRTRSRLMYKTDDQSPFVLALKMSTQGVSL